MSVNWWPIDKHTKIVHRLASIGRRHRNRRHARYLSDHLPFFRSPGDDSVSSAKIKNITRCKCTWITHLPVIAFPCHNVYARRLGRGFTEYKVQSERGYLLCRFEVNVREVFTANKKKGKSRTPFLSCEPSWTTTDNSANYSPSLWILFAHYM